MQNITRLSRVGALCVTLLVAAGRTGLGAQTAVESPPVASTVPDELSQAELLKSYLHVKEQLHAAELAIVNNRLEAEAAARTQAAAITEKLDAIKSVMAAERERQQLEAQQAATERARQQVEVQQAEAERARQQAEAERANRTILWVTSAIGGVGLLALLFTALFQWRAINRIAEIAGVHPQLPGASRQGLLVAETGGFSGQTVALANQRLMSMIDRMERRILELEHTAVPPPPAEPPAESEPARRPVGNPDQAAAIIALLGKGRSLFNANKAEEAMACYDEILRLDTDNPEALVKKGAALERLKQDHEALRCYDRAIQVDRKMTLAYLGKGGVYNRLERYDEAVECYDQALQAADVGK